MATNIKVVGRSHRAQRGRRGSLPGFLRAPAGPAPAARRRVAAGRGAVPFGSDRSHDHHDLFATAPTGENLNHFALVIGPLDLQELRDGRVQRRRRAGDPLGRPGLRDVATSTIPTTTWWNCGPTRPLDAQEFT